MNYCHGLASFTVHRALTPSSQELLGQSEPNLVCSICIVRRQEIINFMTPNPRGGLLFYSGGLFRQTKYIVIMTREGSTKIVNVMTSKTGVLVLGCGHISHIVKTHYFFKNLLLYCQA